MIDYANLIDRVAALITKCRGSELEILETGVMRPGGRGNRFGLNEIIMVIFRLVLALGPDPQGF